MAGSELKTTCIKCKKIVPENGNSICCDSCDGWLHLKCAGLTRKTFSKLANDKDSVFNCKFCEHYNCGKCEKPVYPHHNAICCDIDSCNTWFHLKCTHFNLKEYVDKKSRLHTEDWYCPLCTCIPFNELSNKALSMEFQNNSKKLSEYFNYITSNTNFSDICSICNKKVKKNCT